MHLENLEKQIKESYGRLVYTYTAHNKEVHLLNKKLKIFNSVEIVLTSLTTVGVFTSLLEIDEIQLLVMLLALASSVSLLIIRLINPNLTILNEIDMHNKTAKKLWIIKEEYLSLLTDLNYIDITTLIEIRNKLQADTSEIYKVSPQTSKRAYELSQNALKNDEEQFFSNEELNKILPHHLRRY